MHSRLSDCPRMFTFLANCYHHYSYLGLLLGLHNLVSSSQNAVTSLQSRSSNGAPRSSQLLVTGSSYAGLIRR